MHAFDAAALSAELTQLLADEHVAGATYALVDGDQALVGAVGVAHVPTATALTPTAKMHVGSLTKTVLALGALRLVTERRLDLDAPASRYLPDLPFLNPWQATSPVRVRHLLDHTSGLEDLRLWQAFSAANSPDMPLAEAFARDPGVLTVRTEPGRRFSYSNMGYTVLAMVIEAVVGERYEAWAERALLQPLGMAHSSLRFTTQLGVGAEPGLAWGHQDDLSAVAALPVAVRPAGQFTTTAADMALLARFMLGEGRLPGTSDGAPFVAPALLRAMGQPSTTDAAHAGLRAGYGLGLSARDRHGVTGLCHAGSVIGYRGMLCLFQPQRRAFFIAINTDSETARYDRFDQALIRQLALPAHAPAAGATTLGDEWAGRYVPAPSRFETLRLLDALGSSWIVQAGAAGASLTRPGGHALSLHQVAAGLYRQDDRIAPSHVFMAGPDGERTLSDGLWTLRRVPAAWFYALWASVILGLAGLLHALLATPIRCARWGGSLGQPAFVAVLLLLVPVPMFALQPLAAIGDFTLASASLYVVTFALPLLMLAHVAWVLWLRTIGWRADIVAAACVLQLCVLLAWWGLWPAALWH
ncbi:MAG TPA: serine hydrolase domain-containing protein [Ideonella sp.]|uniref:serine hydrolase domain-containing protein n=1 Tax=Ideonella sp. TaxID=1929293 RepID=UPI002E31FA75|nr:serine hydrolase domain-containing protein [Ideonella sp.]HEX5687038.1 serine hydrolase domain-containing protein [Ideonella sp.]